MSAVANTAVRIYAIVARLIPFQREPFASLYSAVYFAYKRLLEDPFAALARSRPELFRGGDVIDAGANIGYTSLLFARHCDPGATVHAFEPDPDNLAKLRRNVSRSPRGSRVRIHSAALGASARRARLWHNRDHPGDHRVLTPMLGASLSETIEIDLVSIDDQSFRQIAFVKLDVQGFELEVSRGMERTLAANEGVVVALELMPRALLQAGTDPTQLLAFYVDRGFRLHHLGSQARIEAASPDVLLASALDCEYVNVLCSRRPLA